MTTLTFGPGDLAVSVAQDFFLPGDALALLQLYAYQAASLPTDADELRESILGVDSQGMPDTDEAFFPVSQLTPLADVFSNMVEHSERWQRNIHPEIVSTAHALSQYAVKSNRMYQTLIQTINGLQRDPFDLSLRRRLRRLTDRLTVEAERGVTGARMAMKDLDIFTVEAETDAKALEKATAKLQDLFEAEDDQVDEIESQLAKAEADLAEANRRYTTDAIVAGTTPAYRIVGYALMPFTLGISVAVTDVAGVVVSAVFTTEALKAKADIEAALSKIKMLTEAKIAAIRLRAALGVTLRRGLEMGESARAVQPALERVAVMWEQMIKDLARMKTAAVDDPVSIPLLFRGSELEASRVAWQRLGQAADEFRTRAYIRILPEEDEHLQTVEADDGGFIDRETGASNMETEDV